MGRETEWGRRIRERVTAGPVEWSRLVSETASLVPPGRAYRAAIHTIEIRREMLGTAERTYTDGQAKKDQRIRWGQRGIITSLLHSMHRDGRIEFEDRDGERFVTLGPHPWSDPIPLKDHITLYSRAVLELVRDEGYPYDDIFEVVREMIPRGQSIDIARRKRSQNRRRHGNAPTATAVYPDDHDAYIGAKALFTAAVLGLERRHRIEIVESEGRKMIRRGTAWADPS